MKEDTRSGGRVTKRRAGHAPEGSGVPVGTEYHWYIVAHRRSPASARNRNRGAGHSTRAR